MPTFQKSGAKMVPQGTHSPKNHHQHNHPQPTSPLFSLARGSGMEDLGRPLPPSPSTLPSAWGRPPKGDAAPCLTRPRSGSRLRHGGALPSAHQRLPIHFGSRLGASLGPFRSPWFCFSWWLSASLSPGPDSSSIPSPTSHPHHRSTSLPCLRTLLTLPQYTLSPLPPNN